MKATVTHNFKGRKGSVVNGAMLVALTGRLLMIESAFMAVPTALCFFCDRSDVWAFVISTAITFLTGLAIKLWVKPTNTSLGRRDGALLTCMVWVIFSLFGMLPYILGSSHLNVSEAFFEAMSGFTTTGATVIRDIESCGKGIMLWRAVTQWLGGLGIVLFTLTVLPSLNNSKGLFMFHAEVSGITHDKIGARIANTARILWGLYALITAVLIGLLWVGPMNFFESVCHAFATISTGGYSTRNASIAAFNSAYTKGVLTVFMFIGGVNFSLVYLAMKGQIKELWRNDVLRLYVALIAVNYVFTLGSILHSGNYGNWQSLTIDPVFHIVSAMTSTGLGAGNFESWGEIALVLTIIMMFFGACAGSTTGGAKIDRLLYLIKNFGIEVKRSISPRYMKAVRVNNQVVTPERGHEIVAFMMIYVGLILIGGLALSAMDFPIVDAFFSSVSCVANNGLGAGITGVTGSYDFLPGVGKWLMSFLMLAGRLEIFALIALFAPSFWKR